MSERNYYVLCDDNCRFESMTKEQILAAIAEATGNTPTAVDDAFITKIKEQNHNRQLKFWVGTQAEYNAITTKAQDVFYLITDPSIEEEIETRVSDLEDDVDELQGEVGNIADYIVERGTAADWYYTKYASGRLVLELRHLTMHPIEVVQYSGFYCFYWTATLPNSSHIDTPMLNAPDIGWFSCKAGTGYIACGGINLTTGAATMYAMSTSTITTGTEIITNLHIEGNWK